MVKDCQVSLFQLRQTLTVIPQNVLLFKDTLEYNLDPLQIHQRADMKKMLAKLGVLDWPELSGLPEEEMWTYDCDKLRAEGQKQLIGLARGLLAKTKIVILDECTAQLDPQTESRVEAVLEEELRECTVIKIAHRINTILNYDKVLVMQYGETIESGNPRDLLRGSDTMFQQLYAASSSHIS